MAIQLNPQPQDIPEDPAGKSDTLATFAVPVVLTVPHLRGAPSAVVARIEPAAEDIQAANDDSVGAEPEEITPPQPARGWLGTAKDRAASIDWPGMGRWMDRPQVSYSFAAALLLAIAVTIIASPRDSKLTVKPDKGPVKKEAAVQEASPTPGESQLADAPKDVPSPESGSPAAGSNIVKLPPTSAKPEQHALPWRKQGIDGLTKTPTQATKDVPTSRAPEATTQRHEMIPFPPTRSAALAPQTPPGSSSDRPNVARLEGRLQTPKQPR